MNHQLGDSIENSRFSTSEELLELSIQMIQQAGKLVRVFSRDLDAKIFDQEDMLRVFTNFAVSNRHTKLEILVQNSEKMVQIGHRMLETSRRLSSSIKILKTGKQFVNYNEAFVLVDDCGIIHIPVADRYDGNANFNSPLKNKKYQEIFQEAWVDADVDQNLSRLHI